MKAVGASIPRYDGVAHVTGRTRFVDDFRAPAMLWAKALRSPLRLRPGVAPRHDGRRVDAGRARGHHPLRRAPATLYGHQEVWGIPPDEPLLAKHEVRYVGQLIAVVAAETEAQAVAAVQAIEVDFEERAPFFDVRKAWDPDAAASHAERERLLLLPGPAPASDPQGRRRGSLRRRRT